MSRKSTNSQQIDQIVGRRIRLHRMQRGYSQHHLASQLGISYQQLHKYENGNNSVSASRLSDIAAALDIKVDLLFSELNTDEPVQTLQSDSADDLTFDREKSTLLTHLSRIRDPEKRRALKELLASLSCQSDTPN